MNILERVQRICKYHDICESCLLFSEDSNECSLTHMAPCGWDIDDIMKSLREEEHEHRFGR